MGNSNNFTNHTHNTQENNRDNSNVNNSPYNDYTQSSWGSGSQSNYSQDSYTQSDFTESGWGNNSTNSWTSNNVNNIGNLANNYQQNNYQPNDYQQTNSINENYNNQSSQYPLPLDNYNMNNRVMNSSETQINRSEMPNNDFNSQQDYNQGFQNVAVDENENIDISYMNNVPKDDIRADREKIKKYLDSSDLYNRGVVYGYEKEEEPKAKKGGKKFVSIFFIVGTILVISFFIIAFLKEIEIIFTLASIILMILLYTICLLVGLHILLSHINRIKIKRERCKKSVNATIVDIRDVYYSKNSRSCLPIYKFTYNYKVYIIATKTSSNKIILDVGQNIPLFINENEPNDIYVESKIHDVICLLIGLMFILGPIKPFFSLIFETINNSF